MKRSVAAMLLGLMLVCSLVGCGKKDNAANSAPSAAMFSVTGTNAVLYDAAVDFLSKQNDSDVFLPVLGIVGTFENEAGTTCYVLHCDQYIFPGLSKAIADKEGLTGFPGQSVLWMCVEIGADGNVASVKASLDGEPDHPDSIRDICGPLTQLADTILSGSSPSVTETFPDMEPMEMLQLYVDAQN